jgi:oxalate decarboxylase
VGDEPVRVLNVFNRGAYRDVSLNQWLALTPPDLVRGHLGLGDDFMATLTQTRRPVVGG